MLQNTFTPQELTDSFGAVGDGMNSGVSPLTLSKRQLAMAINITVRGDYAKPRPPFQLRLLTAAGKALIIGALSEGPFQGGCFYNPDEGPENIVAAIAGRLFQFMVTETPVVVNEITIPGDKNPQWPLQAWLWQSEKWIVWNDGISLPVFWDGFTSRRSNYNLPESFEIANTAPFIVPTVNSVISGVLVSSDTDIQVGDNIIIRDIGTFLVQAVPGGLSIDLLNLTAQGGVTVTVPIPGDTNISFTHVGRELPPARMGAYGMGRNCVCLIDGKSFVISDLVGGSSGTQEHNYRDAVLKVKENNYLAGGGVFSVPGSVGDIRAMIFAATLNVSLGQGALQVFTHSHVFSCQVPLDRLTWQDITNPILTQSLIGNGALGQNSTVSANSDILFRSIDGMRSLILATREFDTWGNVPQSAEVDSLLDQDSVDLLRFGSAITWDNRLLMTARPIIPKTSVGIYNKALIALNFDPLSTLRGKKPAVYDGIWTGINIFQMVTGEFQETPRAFAFTFNDVSKELEIYQITDTEGTQKDNDKRDIEMEVQSPAIFNAPEGNPLGLALKRLMDGEIYVDSIPAGATANFAVYYRPDGYPCWVPWYQWQECAGTKPETQPDPLLRKPQFRPRMGLGEPSATPCDPTTNRPLREGYTFQIRIQFSNCRFIGARFKAITIPQQAMAPQLPPQCVPMGPG